MKYRMIVKRVIVVAACLALALSVAACGLSDSKREASSADDLIISAASSLRDVLPELEGQPSYQFAGSDALATQIREGAPVDVFLAANTKIPDELHAAGVVDTPIPFATNHVVLVVPTGSKLASIKDLAASPDATIVMAAAGVPLGDYTRKVLDALSQSTLVKRSASFERDAAGVTGKVALGEADAGFVYATDAVSVKGKVHVVDLPDVDVNRATYALAVVTTSKHRAAAKQFVELMTSKRGRAALESAGFGLP